MGFGHIKARDSGASRPPRRLRTPLRGSLISTTQHQPSRPCSLAPNTRLLDGSIQIAPASDLCRPTCPKSLISMLYGITVALAIEIPPGPDRLLRTQAHLYPPFQSRHLLFKITLPQMVCVSPHAVGPPTFPRMESPIIVHNAHIDQALSGPRTCRCKPPQEILVLLLAHF